MPHIVLLEELISLLNQMNVYSHVIGEKLENNEFHGNQVATAESLQSAVASQASSINSSFRTQIENKIGEQESLLGI